MAGLHCRPCGPTLPYAGLAVFILKISTKRNKHIPAMSPPASVAPQASPETADPLHPVEDLLLSGLEITASLFHLGQYCDHWESSLNGHQRAGFHLVLHGPCWLHIKDSPSLQLHAGDAVFFLRDVPHRLSASQACPAFDAPL